MSNLNVLEARIDTLNANLNRWIEAYNIPYGITPAQDRNIAAAPLIMAAIIRAIADTERAIAEEASVRL